MLSSLELKIFFLDSRLQKDKEKRNLPKIERESLALNAFKLGPRRGITNY